mgnify:CR=1 FL=1
MAGWGSGFLASGAIFGRRWVLFAGRAVTALVVTVLVVTVLVMTALVARPGTGC